MCNKCKKEKNGSKENGAAACTSAFLSLSDRQYFQVCKTLQNELCYIISKSPWISVTNPLGQLLNAMMNTIQILSNRTDELRLFDIIETMLREDVKPEHGKKLFDTNYICSNNSKSFHIAHLLYLHDLTIRSEELLSIPIESTSQWSKISVLSAILETIIVPVQNCFRPSNWVGYLATFGIQFFEMYIVWKNTLINNYCSEEDIFERKWKLRKLIKSLRPFKSENPVTDTVSKSYRFRVKRLPKQFYDEVCQLAEKNYPFGIDEKELLRIRKRYGTSECRIKCYLNQCDKNIGSRKKESRNPLASISNSQIFSHD